MFEFYHIAIACALGAICGAAALLIVGIIVTRRTVERGLYPPPKDKE